jgi:hypothetical protein
VVIFITVWSRRSLAAVASLSLVAAYFIINQGASFINSWLSTSSSGSLTSLQLVTAFRLAVIIVLPLFVLFVLKSLGKRQPFIVRLLSAAIFAILLVWYVAENLVSSSILLPLNGGQVYSKLQQFYPILLLAALILAALELWFVRKSADIDKKKKK